MSYYIKVAKENRVSLRTASEVIPLRIWLETEGWCRIHKVIQLRRCINGWVTFKPVGITGVPHLWYGCGVTCYKRKPKASGMYDLSEMEALPFMMPDKKSQAEANDNLLLQL